MGNDELDIHDVGIVVFMRAPGVDARDAATRAEVALRLAVKTSSVESGGLLDELPRGTGQVMPVAGVMEVGTAARNGYLWMRPTGLAARERGLSDD